jgi:hypothetical protein
MRSRVVVAVLIVVSAAVVIWLAIPSGEPEAPPCAPTPAVAPPRVEAAPPPPPRYLRPVGDQYLGEWGRRMATPDDGPPRLFLLTAAELSSYRYGWEMEALSKAMAQELQAVLEEGCRAKTCRADIERARSSLRALIDDDARTRVFGETRTRRWTTGDDVPEEHRSIAITGRLDAIAFDVECTCTSWTVGMRMWNDLADCKATLSEHGHELLHYAPTTLRGSEREAVYYAIDAYDQIVTFAGGSTLTIESGYAYNGDGARTPLTRGAPRGKLSWASR